jgi:pimeloyl-ACP methyl ester carboxylesterase
MTIEFTASDGVRLVADAFGPEGGLPVLLLGGVGQTRYAWRRTAEQLAATGRRAITLDLRGHGDSGWSPSADYRYPRFIADIEGVVRAIGAPAVLVGASLGGKISLAATGYVGSGIARALVMVDTVPRNNWDDSNVVHPPVEGYESLDAAAEAVARASGREFEPGTGERLRRNMRIDEKGRWHWHWDPSLVLGEQGLGRDESVEYLETAAARVSVPVLLARGELSSEVGQEGIDAFRALVPQVEVVTIPGATHMFAGDRNDLFSEALGSFLTRTEGL